MRDETPAFSSIVVGANEAAHLDGALAWFARVSGGACRPAPTPRLSVPAGPDGLRRHAALGGMGPRPWNSQTLAERIVRELPEAARASLAARALFAVAAGTGFHPHTWHPVRGGLRLGSGRWLRRYAFVSADAPLAVLCHELGHLLFEWADVATCDPAATWCLMGRGALHRVDAEAPAPPAPPRLVARGWCRPLPLEPRTPVRAALECVYRWRWGDDAALVEARPSPDDRRAPLTALAWKESDADAPVLLASAPAPAPDAPVLGLVASAIRRRLR